MVWQPQGRLHQTQVSGTDEGSLLARLKKKGSEVIARLSGDTVAPPAPALDQQPAPSHSVAPQKPEVRFAEPEKKTKNKLKYYSGNSLGLHNENVDKEPLVCAISLRFARRPRHQTLRSVCEDKEPGKGTLLVQVIKCLEKWSYSGEAELQRISEVWTQLAEKAVSCISRTHYDHGKGIFGQLKKSFKFNDIISTVFGTYEDREPSSELWDAVLGELGRLLRGQGSSGVFIKIQKRAIKQTKNPDFVTAEPESKKVKTEEQFRGTRRGEQEPDGLYFEAKQVANPPVQRRLSKGS